MTEFWRIYRLVLARRAMIAGLIIVALLTVLIAKRVAQDQMQYLATAVVLPSPQAMQSGGLYKDNKTGVLSSTYDRYSRLSLFTQSIRSHQDDALDLATKSTLEQKRAVVTALSNQLDTQSRQRFLSPNATEDELDAVLRLFKVPTDPAVWAPRTISPDTALKMKDDFDTGPISDAAVNQTPGGPNPTPTMTDYININVRASSPQFAQQVANLTAASFINGYFNSGKDEYDNSIAQIRSNQASAKLAVNQAETALVAFKQKTGIVNLPLQSNAQITDLETLKEKQEAAQEQLDSASKTSAEFSSELHATTPNSKVSFDPSTRPEAQKLALKIADDQAALQTMAARYTAAYPPLLHAQSALQSEQAEYKTLMSQPYFVEHENPQYAQLETGLDTAKQTAAAAQATLSRLNTQIQALEASNSNTLPEAENKLSVLQNTYDTALTNKHAADTAYAGLIQANKALDNGLITMTNPANYATADSSGPGLGALLVYATLLSLIIGIAITVGLDALDNRVQTIGDAEKMLGMPISAVIPAMPPGEQKRMVRMLISDPLSPVAEAYRLLRTDLLFTAEDKPFKSLMGATAKPGQGATTTICNLAVALAQVGKRVILIDADLRRPKLHTFFDVSNETGLTSLLRNECEMEEALKLTDIDNLLILPSGPLPLNPSELLASSRMRTLHERLKPHTDFILVDTPSAIAFSDSAILASFMDAVMLVVRAQEAPRGGELRVREMLSKARANVVGVVLNGVKPQLVDSYHYHAAYYPQIATTSLPTALLEAPSNSALTVGEEQGVSLPSSLTHAQIDPSSTGYGANENGYEATLMGVRLDHHLHLATKNGGDSINGNGSGVLTHSDDNSHADGDAADVTPPAADKPARPRFDWRSLFGTDD